MGLTPDVAAGALIQSAWGNEIRNRTVQQFATTAERDTWVSPPTGSVCITQDTYTLWMWRLGAWRAVPSKGRTSVTTDSNGYANIAHTVGTIPGTVVATSAGPTSGNIPAMIITEIPASTTTVLRIRILNSNGGPYASASAGVNWTAWP